jgi:5-methylcytosine-specific restriction endonuclease McrA
MRQFKRKKKVILKEGEVRPPKKVKKPITSQDDPRFRTMIMSALRQASRWWQPSEACIKKARTGRGVYTCPLCSGKFKQKEMKRDHVDPVIPVTGFVSWDSVVKRMFEQEEAYQGICKTCHAAKTLEENRERRRLAKQKAMVESGEEVSDEDDN